MTIADRANFGPTSHQQQAVQDFDRSWQQAQEAAKSAAWDTFGAAHIPFQDPKRAAQAVGDFGLEQIQKAADEIRETYGAAKQWWNEITNITHTPCEDKWTVIIETALPAAGDAMYLLTTPSPEEILENYLQPYPSKSSRRGAKGDRAKERKKSRSGKTRRRWPRVPDVDSWAAAIIPGAEMVKGRKAGAPTRWAFDAIDRLDRVLWWFLVIDATKTLLNVWSSGMREARFCSQPWEFLWIGSAEGTAGTIGSVTRDEFWKAPTEKNISRQNFDNFFLAGIQPGQQAADMNITVTWTGSIDLPGSNQGAMVDLQVLVSLNDGSQVDLSPPLVPLKNGVMEISTAGNVSNVRAFSVGAALRVAGPSHTVLGETMSVSAFGNLP